jgi:hypothetical protein
LSGPGDFTVLEPRSSTVEEVGDGVSAQRLVQGDERIRIRIEESRRLLQERDAFQLLGLPVMDLA